MTGEDNNTETEVGNNQQAQSNNGVADSELESDAQTSPTSEDNTGVNEEDRGKTDKLFQARVFLEKEKNVYGAEVILFDKDAKEIDKILITDETDFDKFVKLLQNIQKAYVPYTTDDVEIIKILSEYDEDSDEYIRADKMWSALQQKGDLKTILYNNANISEEEEESYENDNYTIINSTHFNGMSSDRFSKDGHMHPDYLTKEHQRAVGIRGELGHVTLVDNLVTSDVSDGKVLSANQGRVLNEEINNLKKKYSWSAVKSVGNYITYRVNTDLKLVQVVYSRNDYTGLKKDVGKHLLLDAGKFPYPPHSRVISPLYRGDITLYFNSDGSVYIYNLSKKDKINIHVQMMWKYK